VSKTIIFIRHEYKVKVMRYLIILQIQNEYTGDGRHSGVMMWPGSEFPYQEKTPTYIQKYNR